MTSRLLLSGVLALSVIACKKKPAEEPVQAQPTATAVDTTPPPSSGVVVATMAEQFQVCFDKEKATSNPPSSAAGTLTVKIETDGKVSSATAAGIDRPSLATCLEDVGKATKFGPQEPPGASIVVPVNLK
jgi:hypothetical protein